MSTKRQIAESSGIYFITITCYKWLSLLNPINVTRLGDVDVDDKILFASSSPGRYF
jgi:hypothetical protein